MGISFPPAAWPESPHATTTDAQLMEAAAVGDVDSFDALYRRHAGVIGGRLRRRCGDRELAEEVLQDTFLAVWNGAAQWNGRGAVRAWIWGIAVRRLADGLRHRSRQRDTAAWHEEAVPSAEDDVLLGLQYGVLGEALDLLPPDLQLVVQATILHQLTTRETAGLLGIPPGTVKTRMMRARAKLKQALDR